MRRRGDYLRSHPQLHRPFDRLRLRPHLQSGQDKTRANERVNALIRTTSAATYRGPPIKFSLLRPRFKLSQLLLATYVQTLNSGNLGFSFQSRRVVRAWPYTKSSSPWGETRAAAGMSEL